VYQPIINDPNLELNNLSKDLIATYMVFLGPNDILVFEKNEETVQRIIDCTIMPDLF
jgi:hypothetical protein